MKHFLIALALLMLAIGQIEAQNNRALLQFHQGDTIYVFGENTNLRAEANTASAVVAQLEAGEKVVILDQSEHTLSLNQRTEHWYKVKTLNQAREGHVWGGLLGCVSARYGDVTFVMNKVGTSQPNVTTMTVRAIQKGKVLYALDVPEFPFSHHEIGEYYLNSQVDNNRGLSGYQSIITFVSDLESDMCDVEGSLTTLTLLWDGKTLSPLPLTGGRGYWRFGTFYLEKYVFPADPDGSKDLILHHEETGKATNEEEENEDEVTEYTKEIRVRKLVKRGNHFVLPQ